MDEMSFYVVIALVATIGGAVIFLMHQVNKHARILEDLQSRLTISVEREVDRYMHEQELEAEVEDALHLQELLDKRR